MCFVFRHRIESVSETGRQGHRASSVDIICPSICIFSGQNSSFRDLITHTQPMIPNILEPSEGPQRRNETVANLSDAREVSPQNFGELSNAEHLRHKISIDINRNHKL